MIESEVKNSPGTDRVDQMLETLLDFLHAA